MQRITIDTNCLIDLENNSSNAEYIRILYKLHVEGNIQLRLPAVAASEKPKKGNEIKTFDDFMKRIERAGLPEIEVLKPYMFLNLSFLGFSMLSDDSMMKLDQEIHQILFPQLPYRFLDYCSQKGIDPTELPLHGKWRNPKCDVMIAWCHIFYDGDILVTRDGNFHKKTKVPKLLEFGAGAIMYPDEALRSLSD